MKRVARPRPILPLVNAIPSHDTFEWLFGNLDRQELRRCYSRWMAALAEVGAGWLVTIDAMGCQKAVAGQIGERRLS